MVRGEHYHTMLLLNVFKGRKEFCHFSPGDPGLVTFTIKQNNISTTQTSLPEYYHVQFRMCTWRFLIMFGWLSVTAQDSGAMHFPWSCFFNMQGSEIPSSSN